MIDIPTLIDCGVSPTLAKGMADPLRTACEQFNVREPLQLATMMAHALHESHRFSTFEENLNYRAGGMMGAWPTRFRTLESTRPLMRDPRAPLTPRSPADPVKLANSVYGGRMGNTEPGDGWKYRGSGIFQITGRDKYRAAGLALGQPFEQQPELVRQSPMGACLTALWYWTTWKNPITCYQAVAQGLPFSKTTQIINGGQIGAADREALFEDCKEAFGV